MSKLLFRIQTNTTLTDLYLIRPPPGASHLPVKPSHIVVAGDSAGGGLTLGIFAYLLFRT